MDSQLFGMDILFCCLTRFGVLEGIRIGKDGCFNMLLVIILMFELIFNFSKSRVRSSYILPIPTDLICGIMLDMLLLVDFEF